MNFIILSEKSWNADLADNLYNRFPEDNFIYINNCEDFNEKYIKEINPNKIFIPHWSYFIPKTIYSKFECIVFHMTDLPYGRGGSPLQNLIIQGKNNTKISAIKVEKEIDAGNIYLKKDLPLFGTAEEIYIRANNVIEQMIIEIIKNKIKPVPQSGEIKFFKRRTPDMSNLKDINTIEKLYDYIRMLDAEGYPSAFIENEYFKFEFTRAVLKSGKQIIADVRITKK